MVRPALEVDRSLGLLLAVEARLREDSVTTRRNLLAALLDEPRLLGYLFGETPPLGAPIALSPDGLLLTTLGVDGSMHFWDLAKRQPAGAWRGPRSASIHPPPGSSKADRRD